MSILHPEDLRFLERARSLARKGWGRVHPNPMVGCLVVREGEVMGQGYHEEFGGPHAEVNALRAAGERARGSTVYVTLEPCNHHGQTPPCVDALVEAGVARVVFGAEDGGEGSGGGAQALRDRGIRVAGPLLTPTEAWWDNGPFHHSRGSDRPWVVLKQAISLDGGIAAGPGERTSLTGAMAGERVHELRAGFQAILVGGGTVRADDPLLTVRGRVIPRVPPLRVVVTASGNLPEGCRILSPPLASGTVVLAGPGVAGDRVEGWRRRGVEVVHCPPAGRGVELASGLRELGRRGVQSVLCEGGSVLSGALLEAGLVDRIHLFVTPRFLGEGRVPAVAGLPRGGGGEWLLSTSPVRWGEDVELTLDRRR